ncbi:MAG TPA: hypothetical protein VII52_10420 [Gemmatimonadaceae bacterium]
MIERTYDKDEQDRLALYARPADVAMPTLRSAFTHHPRRGREDDEHGEHQ